MIIDMHAHLSSEIDQNQDLLKLRDTAQSLNIDKVCIFGTSPEHNEKVRKAIEKYPDFLISSL